MAERLAEVEARLLAIRELQGLVGALRTIAATRVQAAHATLPALRAYADVIAGAVADALLLMPGLVAGPPPPVSGPPGLVAFCAEQGFAGAFSRRVLEAAVEGAPILFLIGTRGAAAAAERGLTPAWCTAMATHVGAVTGTARRIAGELYRRFSAGELGSVATLYVRHGDGRPPAVERRALLPVPLARFRSSRRFPPRVHLEPSRLLERLIEEYFLALLAQATLESLASENAVRLATLQTARDNIARTVEELAGAERRLRQDEITAEILEIVTGSATAR